MSYDLAFLVREGETAPTADSFRQHFRSRRGYKEQANHFWYQNEDTGVYFSFDLQDEEGRAAAGETESVRDGLKPTCLSFNMNYFRPHVFGLEAERELAALVARFSVLVDDPQNDGMARGPYSDAGFLRGWNAGNLFGHRAILRQMAQGNPPASPSIDALPRETLENIWRWNYRRHDLQQDLGDDVFVPGIRLVRSDGGPRSFVVWGDAIPVAVPEVDLLVLVRDELAPRRLFGRKRDTCLVTWSALRPLLGLGRSVEGETPYTLFAHGAAPAPAIVDFFRNQRSHAAKLEGLSADQVLTREVIDEARRTSPGPEA